MPSLKKVSAVLAFMLGAIGTSHAQTTIALTPGEWAAFDVDSFMSQSGGDEWIDLADGGALSFSFTLSAPATLRVVDAGFAGDTFSLSINGAAFATSAVPVGHVATSPNAGLDFDAAWNNASFSRGTFLLSSPGTYTVTGSLLQSVGFDGEALNATVGAVMLAPVPEPTTYVLMLAGLGLLAVGARRRA